MDGLFEDSPLLSAVLAADFIDQLYENRLLTFLTATVVSVYFFVGSKLDVGLTLGLVAWRCSLIASLLHYVGSLQLSLIVGITLGAFLLRHRVLGRESPHQPGPLSVVIGRPADKIEKILEQAFRQYIKHLIQKSPTPLAVHYIPSGIAEASEEVLTSQRPSSLVEPVDRHEIEIKILTPAFYSRFVHYAHDSEAFFCELAESCTFWTDKPERLIKVFLKKGSAPLHATNLVDYVYFQLIRNMRRRPAKVEKPSTSAGKASRPAKGIDIRDFRMSSMDAFVLGQEDDILRKEYRTAVVRLFVADRVTLGNVRLLGMMECVGRVGISWIITSLISHVVPDFP
ncbi:cyclopropane-fatty-acyl-phospholipid synthase [Fusarium heterosporum]|uniref:Cyclopropane-fatty-acyl-phospholipid synthase n=1 Tax=Fusarium heterosporum TaxID=42747 RepID=A0A8H5WIQ6_FUSHE|nr:cyclopropane-fatty-acyl-phospholipid synthase [Fusarium heterosporum]